MHISLATWTQKEKALAQKKGTAMPLRSWKLKWVWWAQFLSYAPQTLLKCKSFGDTQMILKWIFETSSHLKSTKNQFEFQSILKQSLIYVTFLHAFARVQMDRRIRFLWAKMVRNDQEVELPDTRNNEEGKQKDLSFSDIPSVEQKHSKCLLEFNTVFLFYRETFFCF